jgi:hypothetical protein
VCLYAYQLRNQQLTLWVYDPNTPGGDNVTIQLDISRTDQQLIPVTTGISVHGSPPRSTASSPRATSGATRPSR